MKPPLCICSPREKAQEDGWEKDGQWYEYHPICPIHAREREEKQESNGRS